MKYKNLEKNEIELEVIEKTIRTKRNNCLLLRCIAVFFVAIFHLRYLLVLDNNNYLWLRQVVQAFTVIGVNVFIICTGIASFSKKKNNWWHLVYIIFALYVWNIGTELIVCKNISEVNWWSVTLPMILGGGWYIKTYVFFFPIIPLLNRTIKNKKDSWLFLIFFAIFSIVEYRGLSIVDDAYGFHILHFIFMYMATRAVLILKYNYQFNKKKSYPIIIFIYLMCVLELFLLYWFYSDAVIYNTFDVVCCSFCFVLLFMDMDVKFRGFNKFFKFVGLYSLWFYTFDNMWLLLLKQYPWAEIVSNDIGSFVILFLISFICKTAIVFIYSLLEKSFKKIKRYCKYGGEIFPPNTLMISEEKVINEVVPSFKQTIKIIQKLLSENKPQAKAIYLIYVNKALTLNKIHQETNLDTKDLYKLVERQILVYKNGEYTINNQYRWIENYLGK